MLCRPSRGGASRNKVSAADQAAAEAVAPPVGARVEIIMGSLMDSVGERRPSRGGASRNCVLYDKIVPVEVAPSAGA